MLFLSENEFLLEKRASSILDDILQKSKQIKTMCLEIQIYTHIQLRI